MASNPVKVLVVVPERKDQDDKLIGVGYWAAGRCWPYGTTEAVLEDDASKTVEEYDPVKGVLVPRTIAGLTVAQKLEQLKHAKGGQPLVDQYDEKGKPRKAPAMLGYTVIAEVKTEAPPAVRR